MLAAGSGDQNLVNTLIEFDARVEDTDRDGNTAIFYAKNKKILDILRLHDKSSEPVTHFPSKLPSPPLAETPDDINLDTWDDSNMSSDEDAEDKTNKRLVKSKVSLKHL